ncbi:hypothetical protein C7212DRAFT_340848 [Tuber magnatum]|uniref:Uncharacterized protein n=1 Tax=Tuber magnatum TaxID=42249 RepID=A0A317T205_9PEZI|nr:hypothetical protein C7212DRAFT_340848 [Tuber magnatum]
MFKPLLEKVYPNKHDKSMHEYRTRHEWQQVDTTTPSRILALPFPSNRVNYVSEGFPASPWQVQDDAGTVPYTGRRMSAFEPLWFITNATSSVSQGPDCVAEPLQFPSSRLMPLGWTDTWVRGSGRKAYEERNIASTNGTPPPRYITTAPNRTKNRM